MSALIGSTCATFNYRQQWKQQSALFSSKLTEAISVCKSLNSFDEHRIVWLPHALDAPFLHSPCIGFPTLKATETGKCVCAGGGGEAKSKLRAEPQNSRYTRNSELVLVAELCACSPFCLPLYGTVNLVRLPPPSLSVGLKLESCSCDVWAINFQLQRSQLYCCKCNCFPSISSGLWVFLLSVFPCRNFGS